MKVEFDFSVNEVEMELYETYGKPALELFSKGNYAAAVTLIDEVLVKNSDTEFALVLKSYFLMNNILSDVAADSLKESLLNEDFDSLQTINLHLEDLFERTLVCKNFIDKALTINAENECTLTIKNQLDQLESLIDEMKGDLLEIVASLASKESNNEYQFSANFRLKSDEKLLYQDYGIPAEKLASNGKFHEAIELIDKALKINPHADFAIILKMLFSSDTLPSELKEISDCVNYIADVKESRKSLNKYEIREANKMVFESNELINRRKREMDSFLTVIENILEEEPYNHYAKRMKEAVEEARWSLQDIVIPSFHLPEDI